MSATSVAATRGAAWAAKRFSGLPPTFWWLFGGVGVARLAFFVVPFRTFYLAHDRHLDAVASSLVMTAFGVGWALSQPLGGVAADRIGRRTVIVASAWGSAAAFLAFGSAHALFSLAATALLAGLSFDAYRPAVQALISDLVAATNRARALALLYLVMNVGRGAACVLGGLLAEHSFWLLFVINAVANAGFGLAVLLVIEDAAPGKATQAGHHPRLLHVLSDRRLLAFTAVTLAFYTIHMQSALTLPLVMDRSGATPLAFGLLLALDPLAVALIQLVTQDMISRAPALKICAAGVAIVGVGLAITGSGHSVVWFAATIPIWVGGEVLFLTVAPGVVAAIAPPDLRGSYFGVWGCTQGLAAVIAPAIAAVTITVGGFALVWTVGVFAGLVTAAGCLLLDRRHPQPKVS
jgi:MFS family permease